MKNWTWKQWTAFGIIVAIIIAEVVMVFTAPGTALFGVIMAAAGFIAGLIAKDHVIVKGYDNNKEENEFRMTQR